MYQTYFNGQWSQGNTPLYGAMDNAVWLSSSVFDGARAIAGKMPDLRPHLQRVIKSAECLGLICPYSVDEMEALCREGVALFAPDAELYIRPLVFGTEGLLVSVPEKSSFALTIFDAPMPAMTGFSACLSKLLRPNQLMAPTDAKASCLYANSTRALRDAQSRGCDNAVMLDGEGHVAEFATANIFFVTAENEIVTPIPNGTFLNGITRQRIIALLAEVGVKVIERSVRAEELLTAKEIFNTGNYGKVVPCVKYEGRELPVGDVAKRTRALYMEFMANS